MKYYQESKQLCVSIILCIEQTRRLWVYEGIVPKCALWNTSIPKYVSR